MFIFPNNSNTMKTLTRLFSIFIILSALTGCVESLSNSAFSVTCTIDKSLGTDSVTLLLLEEDYNRLYSMGTVAADSATGIFRFEGQMEKPCVALLKFSNDSTPFFFVLEQGNTAINIGTGTTTIEAGEGNHSYIDFLKRRNSLEAQRRQLRNNYLQMAARDSIVDIKEEALMAQRDSILADSIDRITVAAINQGTPAARIIFDRFATTLSPTHLHNINKERK